MAFRNMDDQCFHSEQALHYLFGKSEVTAQAYHVKILNHTTRIAYALDICTIVSFEWYVNLEGLNSV